MSKNFKTGATTQEGRKKCIKKERLGSDITFQRTKCKTEAIEKLPENTVEIEIFHLSSSKFCELYKKPVKTNEEFEKTLTQKYAMVAENKRLFEFENVKR